MAEAHRRQKQPQLIREQLLAVVRSLLVDQGPHAVTLDAVAKRANVTKGGLQHHFPSKQTLLEALADQLFEEFESSFAHALSQEAESPARHARAYIRTCFNINPDGHTVETQRAIGLLALTLPQCRERWHAAMQAALAADGNDPETANRLLLCRLAGDGFWFAQMLDVYDLDAPRKEAILKMLLALCDGTQTP